jgi:hypothetical protein
MDDSRIIIEDYLDKEVVNYFSITSSHECRVNMRKIGRNDGLELDELTRWASLSCVSIRRDAG